MRTEPYYVKAVGVPGHVVPGKKPHKGVVVLSDFVDRTHPVVVGLELQALAVDATTGSPVPGFVFGAIVVPKTRDRTTFQFRVGEGTIPNGTRVRLVLVTQGRHMCQSDPVVVDDYPTP